MRTLFTSEQVRQIEQQAIDSGLSAGSLMQAAAAAALRAIERHWPSFRRVLIVCGAGNNAGDGYEIARQAQAAGWQVQLLYLKEPNELSGPALAASQQALAAGVDCQPFSEQQARDWLDADRSGMGGRPSGVRPCVIVDAILGIGFKGQLRPRWRRAVELINELASSARAVASVAPTIAVFAMDVPSGINADTGVASDLGLAVQADLTLSVVARKQGLYTGDAPAFTGELLLDELGTAELGTAELGTPQFSARMRPSAMAIDAGILADARLARSRTAHKGDSGHVLVIGGDLGFGGAAIMAAEAAARAGAGTVSLLTRSAHTGAALARRPEIMVQALDQWDGAEQLTSLIRGATALVLGPGMGQGAWCHSILTEVFRLVADAAQTDRPLSLVLDADALNWLAAQKLCWDQLAPAQVRAQWVITPHPGEAARLLGWTLQQVVEDRFAAVRALQTLTGTVCVLKGAGSLLGFPGSESVDGPEEIPVNVCLEGNPGMACGGMGDVLAGICGALSALGQRRRNAGDRHQLFDAAQAARFAVCAHGEAGDLAAAALGERGLLATDLLSYLPGLLSGPDHLKGR